MVHILIVPPSIVLCCQWEAASTNILTMLNDFKGHPIKMSMFKKFEEAIKKKATDAMQEYFTTITSVASMDNMDGVYRLSQYYVDANREYACHDTLTHTHTRVMYTLRHAGRLHIHGDTHTKHDSPHS